MRSVLLSVFLIALTNAPKVYALGERLVVYEAISEGGAWDHGNEIYMRFSTQHFPYVWVGLTQQAADRYSGEVVLDQFGPNEKRIAAKAILHRNDSGKLVALSFTVPGESKPTRFYLEIAAGQGR